MNRSTLYLSMRLSLALLVAGTTGARAQNGMPADCPMHAEHQKKAAEAAATAVALATSGSGHATLAEQTGDTAHTGHTATTAPVSGAVPGAPSPYVGMTEREIAALSEEEIAALRTGSGHGMALPAEIHHYPGPRHLIDLGAELGLDARATTELQAIYERMHRDAVSFGEQIVAGERELDRLFADGRATSTEVSRLTGEVARLQGQLRATHLVAHVESKVFLTADQVARYDTLRGYTSVVGAP